MQIKYLTVIKYYIIDLWVIDKKHNCCQMIHELLIKSTIAA